MHLYYSVNIGIAQSNGKYLRGGNPVQLYRFIGRRRAALFSKRVQAAAEHGFGGEQRLCRSRKCRRDIRTLCCRSGHQFWWTFGGGTASHYLARYRDLSFPVSALKACSPAAEPLFSFHDAAAAAARHTCMDHRARRHTAALLREPYCRAGAVWHVLLRAFGAQDDFSSLRTAQKRSIIDKILQKRSILCLNRTAYLITRSRPRASIASMDVTAANIT